MKLYELFEEKIEKILPIDQIALALFKKKAGIVKDSKRNKDKVYLGVQHSASVLKKSDGRELYLTFDNSTDSEEFAIDSLTPLKIEKDGNIDKAIKKIFNKHELGSKKSLSYMVKGDISYLREIHLGEKLGSSAVRIVKDLIKLLKIDQPEVSDKEEE